MEATTAPWLVFIDADNFAPDGYLSAIHQAITAAAPNLGIVYPDIQYVDETGKPQRLWVMPNWNYWGIRAQNCIDTSSAWRREAIELAGGWPLGHFGAQEDYALALLVTAAGWEAARLDGPAMLMREHPEGRRQQRRRDGEILTDLWRARSLAIVSLLAGRAQTLEQWAGFLMRAELPPRTALYVLDNGGDPAFTRRVFDICTRITGQRSLYHVDFGLAGQPYRPDLAESYMTRRRHSHVARLYATVLPRVAEDLVLTLEDDVEPPPDAARRLGEEIGYTARGKVGAVASAYSTATAEDALCAGWGSDRWGPLVRWQELPAEPIDVGFVGGGCTVWANWALRNCPAHVQWDRTLGWDGVLCRELRRRGYGVRLHGGVRSRHHLGDRMQSEISRSPIAQRVLPPRMLPEPRYELRPRPAPPPATGNGEARQTPVRPPPGSFSPSGSALMHPVGDVDGRLVPRLAPPASAPAVSAGTSPSSRPAAAAARYRAVDDLCILTCYFNSERYHSKRHNYERFKQSIVDSGIAFLAIECTFDSDESELAHEPNTIQVRAQDVMWHKENLLNLGMAYVPSRFTKIGWIDGDVLFENPDWAFTTSALLDRYAVVQPFSEAFRLPPGEEIYRGIGDRYDGFAAVHSVLPSVSRVGGFVEHGHTGFAWAARRDILCELHLYDAAILGGADDLMAHAFCADFGSKCLDDAFLGNDAHRRHFTQWAEAAWKAVQGRIGFVPGAVLHLWHGEDRNRGYGERRVALARFQFDPMQDLRRDPSGLWQWRDRTTPLADWVRAYFAHRREDVREPCAAGAFHHG